MPPHRQAVNVSGYFFATFQLIMAENLSKNSKLETEPFKLTKEWLYDFYGIEKKKDEFQMEKFQEKYEGITIAKHYDGKILKNNFGKCYHISSSTEIEIFEPNHDSVKQKLLLDLKVISGIAEITENNLKVEGITTISQLENHYRYGNQAKKFIPKLNHLNLLNRLNENETRHTCLRRTP